MKMCMLKVETDITHIPKATQYEILMKEAAQDKKFLTRTISCAEDFCAVDGEVSGKW